MVPRGLPQVLAVRLKKSTRKLFSCRKAFWSTQGDGFHWFPLFSHCFPCVSTGFPVVSTGFPLGDGFHWFPRVSIGFPVVSTGFPLVSIGFHWLPLVSNGFHWFPTGFPLVSHWFPTGFHWFPLLPRALPQVVAVSLQKSTRMLFSCRKAFWSTQGGGDFRDLRFP